MKNFEVLKMTIKQKRAIWYNIRKKNLDAQLYFIQKHDGDFMKWNLSKYKSPLWYIRANYGVSVYYNGIYKYN